MADFGGLHVETVVVGWLKTNCYIVSCCETGETVVIDPGAGIPKIRNVIEANGLKVRAIINTHHHHDHSDGNQALKNLVDAPVCIGETEAEYWGGRGVDRMLRDNEEITFGQQSLRVILTPGHTRGGICLYHPGVLFSGDTLFSEDVGRSDLAGGDEPTLHASIRNRLFVLADDTVVYPGHDEPTTIGHEKQNNPIVR